MFGLYSNVAEWTDSPAFPYRPDLHPLNYPYSETVRRRWQDSRIVRGAPPAVFQGRAPAAEDLPLGPDWLTPCWRGQAERDGRSDKIGFRCARSVRPRYLD